MSNYDINEIGGASRVFKALSNHNRLRIFLRIAQCCIPDTMECQDKAADCCVGDLGAEVRISPSTLSHHLKELNRSGLIQMERRGQFVYCHVNVETAKAVEKFLAAIAPATNSSLEVADHPITNRST